MPALTLFWHTLLGFLRRLNRGRLFLTAAALSYYGFMAAIPGLLLFLSVGSYILGSGVRAETVLAVALRHIFPEAAATGRAALESAAQAILAHRGVVSGISLLALAWAGTNLFDALELSLNSVWHVPQDRPYHWRKLRSFAWVVAAGVLSWVSFAITTVMQITAEAAYRATNQIGVVWHAYQALGAFLAILLAWFTFGLLYVVLPNTRVRFGPAALGAAAAAILWEFAKTGFNAAMVLARGYQPVYGSTAKLIVALVWLYITSALILLGAHLAATIQGAAERGRCPHGLRDREGRPTGWPCPRSWIRERSRQRAGAGAARASGRASFPRAASSASRSGRRKTVARASQK
jgi:membrane protein